MRIVDRLKLIFWAILPFALFPTSFLWNSALHKDGLFILGSMLTLDGFILFSQTSRIEHFKRIVKATACLVFGLFLVWVVMPYGF